MHKLYLGALVTSILTGCGGGSDGASGPVQTTYTPLESSWEFGVFHPASQYKNKCKVVRSHLDINGNYYPDEQGTEDDEKLWLRSWSNETYLWYDEIADTNPVNFSSPQSYFRSLKTNQKTASGAHKDNFHFYQPTADFESFSQSGTKSGYGIDWTFLDTTPPRDIRVVTVDSNSSAGIEGVVRGDRLIRVNGEDVIYGHNVDFFNKAMFPSEDSSQYEFTFERIDGSEVTYTLISGVYEKSFVNNVSVINTSSGKVGYLRFDGFQSPAQEPLIQGIKTLADENVTDLVLDLRYNGGGLLAMSSQLAYMIAGPQKTADKTFETLQYNNRIPDTNPITGQVVKPTPFHTKAIDWSQFILTNRALPSLNLNRLFVLTTDETCSASEALINGLRGIDVEVIQIGGTTCGKPYGFIPTDNCGTTYYTIQFRGVNNKGFGDYADGFKPTGYPVYGDELPGCRVSDDFNHQLGDTNEEMLRTALERRRTGYCPLPLSRSAEQVGSAQKRSDDQDALPLFDSRYRSILLENRIFVPIKDNRNE